MTRVMESLRMAAGLFDLDAIPPGPGLVKAAMVRAALTTLDEGAHVIDMAEGGIGYAVAITDTKEETMMSLWGTLV